MSLLSKIFKKKEKILPKIERKTLAKRYLLLLVAIVIYAISYNLFFFHNNIVYGGVSGISIITSKIVDPAIMIFALNVLLLLLSLIFLGKKQTLDSIVGSILFPIFVKLTQNIGNIIELDYSNLLLIVIVGGVFTGFAAGIVFKSGFTTGGTDILNQIIAKYFKVSLGTSMLMSDGIIVLVGGFFFGWTRVLYALIVLYIINIMVDKVVLGISNSKAVYITTNKDDDICDYLLKELNLGITLIDTRGGFTNNKDQIIMCVVPTNDYFKVSEGIKLIDPEAVVLVTDAYQTSGVYTGKTKEA